jgi:hypothetical protein
MQLLQASFRTKRKDAESDEEKAAHPLIKNSKKDSAYSYEYPTYYWGLDWYPSTYTLETSKPLSQYWPQFQFFSSGDDFGAAGFQTPICTVEFPDTQNYTDKTLFGKLSSKIQRVSSHFAFGICPKIVKSQKVKLTMSLDTERDGTNSSGYNPSIIPLPSNLQASFPSGRWLGAIRVGDELRIACPWVTPFNSTKRNYSNEEIHEHKGYGTYAVVLDRDFSVLARTKIREHNQIGVYEERSIQDARITPLDNGDILIAFTPYNYEHSPLKMGEFSGAQEGSWFLRQFVAKLHLSATPDSGVNAWIEREEIRDVTNCPNDHKAHKNMGFFESDGQLYAVDEIFPPKVASVNLNSPSPPTSNHNNGSFIPQTCLTSALHGPDPLRHSNPYAFTRGQASNGAEQAKIHNGPSPIWIEELGLFLGVGHLRRGYGFGYGIYRWSHHYMSQFYTISGKEPFSIHHLSGEFCFESEQRPNDCEITQFVSSINRDGDSLVVGFGVLDCEAYVTKLDLTSVLQALVQLD